MANRRHRERGTALVEFALCFALFWLPLFMGTLVIGLNLVQVAQVTQVCRDAAHMYAYGTDFSQPSAQDLLITLAPTLGMTTTGGNAVVVLSTVQTIYLGDCQAYTTDLRQCANLGKTVFTRRLVIGNKSLVSEATSYGSPNGNIVDPSSGTISIANYLNDPSAITVNFTAITLSAGQSAYIGETTAISPEASWWAALSGIHPTARFIF